MENQIFRKKSLERVNSPEDLNDYLRVTSPAIWILLSAVIVLLLGATIWGMFGLLETTLYKTAYVQNGQAYIYLEEEECDSVKVGMTLSIGDAKCVVKDISETALPLQHYLDEFYGEGYVWENQVEDPDALVKQVSSDTHLANGMYAAQMVVEQVHPISFLFN